MINQALSQESEQTLRQKHWVISLNLRLKSLHRRCKRMLDYLRCWLFIDKTKKNKGAFSEKEFPDQTKVTCGRVSDWLTVNHLKWSRINNSWHHQPISRQLVLIRLWLDKRWFINEKTKRANVSLPLLRAHLGFVIVKCQQYILMGVCYLLSVCFGCPPFKKLVETKMKPVSANALAKYSYASAENQKNGWGVMKTIKGFLGLSTDDESMSKKT